MFCVPQNRGGILFFHKVEVCKPLIRVLWHTEYKYIAFFKQLLRIYRTIKYFYFLKLYVYINRTPREKVGLPAIVSPEENISIKSALK